MTTCAVASAAATFRTAPWRSRPRPDSRPRGAIRRRGETNRLRAAVARARAAESPLRRNGFEAKAREIRVSHDIPRIAITVSRASRASRHGPQARVKLDVLEATPAAFRKI